MRISSFSVPSAATLSACVCPRVNSDELLVGGPLRCGRRVLLDDRRLDGLRGVLALELVLDLGRLVELRAVRGADLIEQLRVDLDLHELFLRLADLLGEFALQRAELL